VSDEIPEYEMARLKRGAAIARELKFLFDLEGAGFDVTWLINLKRNEIRHLGDEYKDAKTGL
jgi:hypothetical protein